MERVFHQRTAADCGIFRIVFIVIPSQAETERAVFSCQESGIRHEHFTIPEFLHRIDPVVNLKSRIADFLLMGEIPERYAIRQMELQPDPFRRGMELVIIRASGFLQKQFQHIAGLPGFLIVCIGPVFRIIRLEQCKQPDPGCFRTDQRRCGIFPKLSERTDFWISSAMKDVFEPSSTITVMLLARGGSR